MMAHSLIFDAQEQDTMKLKPISLILAALLALSLLAGCGSGTAGQNAADPGTPAATADVTPAETPTEAPAETPAALPDLPTPDYDAMYAVYAPDYVPVTIDGQAVTWQQYFGWAHSVMDQLYMYYGITDFTEEMGEGLTYTDFVHDYVESMCGQYSIVYARSGELGITLSAEEEQEVDRMLQEDADSYFNGDLQALEDDLNGRYFTLDYYRRMSGAALLYQDLFTHFYGENGADLPDEDAVNYFLDNGYMNAKHILFRTVDDSYQSLSEEEKAAKLAQAEAVLAQLQETSPEELEGVFTRLMTEQSEDPGSITRPDGYYFQTGEMVAPFEEAAAALEQGGLSGIVESDFGYHILYRPQVSADHIFTYDTSGNAITVRYQAASALFSIMEQQWVEDMEVVYADDFDLNRVIEAGKTA